MKRVPLSEMKRCGGIQGVDGCEGFYGLLRFRVLRSGDQGSGLGCATSLIKIKLSAVR